jgi:hypothetical protein
MKQLLNKLNYKKYSRIAVLNFGEHFLKAISGELENVMTDSEIDQRYAYDFMLIFVKSVKEINYYSPIALHNLTADGILWFIYPRRNSKKNSADLVANKNWKILNNLGFYGIRMVSVDNDWSAMRFRNIKYIKSKSAKLPVR